MTRIFTVHVELMHLQPAIWRRLEVPTHSSFWDFHCAIQDAMPWQDCHLHEFRFPTGDAQTQIGIPDPESISDPEFVASWHAPLADWFPGIPGRCSYIYDFGDYWEHQITIELVGDGTKGQRYPRCTGGEGRCPPEDVGGVPGFLHFKEAMATPGHEDHQELIEWFGAVWKETGFDPASVKFHSSRRRLRESGLIPSGSS